LSFAGLGSLRSTSNRGEKKKCHCAQKIHSRRSSEKATERDAVIFKNQAHKTKLSSLIASREQKMALRKRCIRAGHRRARGSLSDACITYRSQNEPPSSTCYFLKFEKRSRTIRSTTNSSYRYLYGRCIAKEQVRRR
jgi:hypothetical protein